MKIGVYMPCYGTNSFFVRAVKALDKVPEVERIIVASSQWYEQGAQDIIADNTAELYAEKIKSKTRCDVQFHEGYWTTEEASRNDGIGMLSDMDWIFMLDPDEFILPSLWPWMLEQISILPNSPVIAGQFEDYWKYDPADAKRNECYVIRPRRDHLPIFAIKPNGTQNVFCDGRCVPSGVPVFRMPGVLIHHFGLCHPDEQMAWKCSNYTDRGAKKDPEWLDKVWFAWDTDHAIENLALGRAQRDGMKCAVPHVPPDELVNLLSEQ